MVATGLWILFSLIGFSRAITLAPDEIASSYALSSSTSLPFPRQTLKSSEAQSEIIDEWSLAKGRIQDGAPNLQFVDDPYPDSAPPSGSDWSDSVLQVTYAEGSFSHDTGGAQFINLWNGTEFDTMMISYEVAFQEDFDWVKGGKLPGIRGGDATTGCSGGNQPTGSDCFSVRAMWRSDGLGEAYAYMPTPNDLCSLSSFRCNDDFGVSISRGSFVLSSGGWNRITILVQLNNPSNIANGQIQLFYNDVSVIIQEGLQLRSSTSLHANGMYFSTFFGGSDSSWATPKTTQTYFRNISMWGSNQPSTLTGAEVSAAFVIEPPWAFLAWLVATFSLLLL